MGEIAAMTYELVIHIKGEPNDLTVTGPRDELADLAGILARSPGIGLMTLRDTRHIPVQHWNLQH